MLKFFLSFFLRLHRHVLLDLVSTRARRPQTRRFGLQIPSFRFLHQLLHHVFQMFLWPPTTLHLMAQHPLI